MVLPLAPQHCSRCLNSLVSSSAHSGGSLSWSNLLEGMTQNLKGLSRQRSEDNVVRLCPFAPHNRHVNQQPLACTEQALLRLSHYVFLQPHVIGGTFTSAASATKNRWMADRAQDPVVIHFCFHTAVPSTNGNLHFGVQSQLGTDVTVVCPRREPCSREGGKQELSEARAIRNPG